MPECVFAGTLAVLVSPWLLGDLVLFFFCKKNSTCLRYCSHKHKEPGLLDEFLRCKQLCDHFQIKLQDISSTQLTP